MLDQAIAQTRLRATGARQAKRVMGAIRFYVANDKAITAYFLYLPRDRKLRSDVVGFANPSGMNLADWAHICTHGAWRVAPDTATVAVTT